MTFRPADKAHAHLHRLLPTQAVADWCDGANAAAEAGADYNAAVRAAWDAVDKSWYRPNRKKPYVRKPADMPKPTPVAKADPRTLYVRRDLLNGADLAAWAKEQGFKTTLPPADMHVTLAFSRNPVDWDLVESTRPPDRYTIGDAPANEREVKPLGDKGAMVLAFRSAGLTDRWQQIKDAGASWDFPEYKPHVTITYDAGDVGEVSPYTGPLLFGPEVLEEVNEDWAAEVKDKLVATGKGIEKRGTIRIVKVDEEQRMAYGWAYVSTEDGKLLQDSQGDSIEPVELEKAATDFMIDVRVGMAMHPRDAGGNIDPADQVALVVHSFPMTGDVMKAVGIESKREGWVVGVKVLDDDVWAQVKSGDLAAFSIGGSSAFESNEAAAP